MQSRSSLNPEIQSFLKELDQLRALDGAVEEAEVDAPEARPGDQRELLPAEAVLEHRGAALARPGLDAGRPLAQSRLVDEEEVSGFLCAEAG